jgi:hypothetical protein
VSKACLVAWGGVHLLHVQCSLLSKAYLVHGAVYICCFSKFLLEKSSPT